MEDAEIRDAEKQLEKEYERYMHIALEEAYKSLKEGNNGFGAVVVIVKKREIIAKAHDTENVDSDPTAHAELNAIRIASKKFGKDLSESILFSTHEPCPMCTTALIWARIQGIVYSVSIKEALELGRTRIDLPCEELIERANAPIWVKKGVLKEKCITLYES
ncbi:MAG: Cytidine/deoxycytidylate deaminase, zinc-binding region [Promethearchaeota archaeon]|jgi:tRNA(Arg) A34 adenosine deaminase TadA|nr:MAG: Cytidine/deoxycytidylate deaminase, zinc-binding region [Candidatus Lokiarchaeota archaeon]